MMKMVKKFMLSGILMIGVCCGITARTTAMRQGNTTGVTLDKQKIVVVADPHVMAPELLVSEGSAWTTYLNGQRKLVDYSKRLFDVMIDRIKKELRPGLVLIPGDLTKDCEKLSHQYVISKLDELRDLGIQTLVIPGNHDRGSNSNAKYYDGASTTNAEVADNAWFATQYANYGYGAGSERESTSLTYSCEPIKGLVVIGIDSGTDGVVSSTTLNWVVEKATAARKSGKKVIAMMHHPLVPHFTGVGNFVESAVVEDYETVRNALADAGIKVVFTGHFHTSDIAMDKNADLSREIYDVNTGSLISYPCDYRELTLSNDLSKMTITTGHISELTSGDGFATTAKTRLHSAMEAQVAKQGTAYTYVKTQAADAFIIHAEGNEPDNANAATILNQFKSLASKAAALVGKEKAKALLDMANSMLEDKSQYGVEGRENVTNDLTLELGLPELVELADDGYATYCSENKLDVSQTDGLAAYIVSKVTSSTVELRSVNVIPANTGFVVKGKGGALCDLFVSDASADNVSANKLHGTLTATAAPANTFALSTKGGVAGFYPVQTGLSIPAHKAYLTVSGGGARTITFEEEATGIDNVEEKVNILNGTFYNLAGQRVSTPTKGMYIVNGKKVIIK